MKWSFAVHHPRVYRTGLPLSLKAFILQQKHTAAQRVLRKSRQLSLWTWTGHRADNYEVNFVWRVKVSIFQNMGKMWTTGVISTSCLNMIIFQFVLHVEDTDCIICSKHNSIFPNVFKGSPTCVIFAWCLMVSFVLSVQPEEHRENFFSTVNFVCRLLFGVCSIPMLLQWHVKDASHSS